jgi:hypothetical protein
MSEMNDDRPATKRDLAQFATKDDLAQFATKDDLAQFATKDDLAQLATKDDLAKLSTATKGDVAELRGEFTRFNDAQRGMALEIVRIQSRLDSVEANMATKSDVKRILDSVDAFARRAEGYDRVAALHGHVLTEVQVQVKGHESRIKTLENRPGQNPL